MSRYIKSIKQKNILSVAVEPEASPVITQTLQGQPAKAGPHRIEGIGAGFLPDTLDLSIVNQVEAVSNEEAIETAQRLPREEGILSASPPGPQSRWLCDSTRKPEYKGKTIVVVLPDSGERYLSSVLFEGIF